MSHKNGKCEVLVSLWKYAYFTSASLLIGCAEVAPPPGGSPDKTSPFLIASVPENGSVNVKPGNSITLFFSERIVRPTSGKAVFISPRPLQEPKLKWKSNRIEIILPDSFRTNQTYIVSLSSSLADLRGNKLDSASIIAFSTGAFIDSGCVAGHVFSDNRPAGGLMVGMYDLAVFEDSTVLFDSLYPGYISQTNTEGYFTFEYLPQREYRLVAFNDKNRDERFNPWREPFALPDRPIIVGGDMPLDDLQLFLTEQDTVRAEILSVLYTADRLLKIRLSRAIPLDLLRRSPSNLLLKSQDDTLQVYPAKSFLESDQDKVSVLNCYLGLLSEGMYDLELTYDVAVPPLRFLDIKIEAAKDENVPTIMRFYPGPIAEFIDRIKIQAVFSEPIDKAKIGTETFILLENRTTQVPLTLSWEDDFHLLLLPSKLIEGTVYRLSVNESEIVDLAGNPLGDSLSEYQFSTFDPDSLGSASGEVVVNIPGKENSTVILSFRRVGRQRIFDVAILGRQFKVDLPGGKYLLSGFIDSDLDEKRGKGSIYPFRLAETSASFPDTIAVRPRFETTGIRFEFK
ncbi:MAG: Ig-like domain-containing protein [Candidatus Zixiibacteriota bacterium]